MARDVLLQGTGLEYLYFRIDRKEHRVPLQYMS